jgi:hypothetical protein
VGHRPPLINIGIGEVIGFKGTIRVDPWTPDGTPVLHRTNWPS